MTNPHIAKAVEALEYCGARYHRTFPTPTSIKEWHDCAECGAVLDGPACKSALDLPHDKDCTTANALASLRSLPESGRPKREKYWNESVDYFINDLNEYCDQLELAQSSEQVKVMRESVAWVLENCMIEPMKYDTDLGEFIRAIEKLKALTTQADGLKGEA